MENIQKYRVTDLSKLSCNQFKADDALLISHKKDNGTGYTSMHFNMSELSTAISQHWFRTEFELLYSISQQGLSYKFNEITDFDRDDNGRISCDLQDSAVNIISCENHINSIYLFFPESSGDNQNRQIRDFFVRIQLNANTASPEIIFPPGFTYENPDGELPSFEYLDFAENEPITLIYYFTEFAPDVFGVTVDSLKEISEKHE